MAQIPDAIINVKMPIIEELADLCHRQWSGWMYHLFKSGTLNDDGTFTMDADKVERWNRQALTPYVALSESEQESDRKEARKFLHVFAGGKAQ